MGNQEQDHWAQLGRAMKVDPHGSYEALSLESGGKLVELLNDAAPFSSATGIIDVGCGSGAVFAALFERYGSVIPTSAKLVASDKSPGMIDALKKRQKDAIESGSAEWARVIPHVMAAEDLGAFQDGSFSHVLCANTLYAVSDYRKAVQEAKRVLQPGGTYAFSLNATYPWVDLMKFVSKVRPEKVIPNPPSQWSSEEGVAGVMEEGGFTVLKTAMVDIYMPWDDHMHIVEGLFMTLPFMPRVTEDMTNEEIVKSKDLMLEHLKETYPTKPYRMHGKGAMAVGRKD